MTGLAKASPRPRSSPGLPRHARSAAQQPAIAVRRGATPGDAERGAATGTDTARKRSQALGAVSHLSRRLAQGKGESEIRDREGIGKRGERKKRTETGKDEGKDTIYLDKNLKGT